MFSASVEAMSEGSSVSASAAWAMTSVLPPVPAWMLYAVEWVAWRQRRPASASAAKVSTKSVLRSR